VRRYLDLIRTPGVAPLLVAGALARLPYGMYVLALVLLLRAEGFSFAEVGVVGGASGAAVGLTAPLVGRAVDRLGQTRVLVAGACVTVAADSALSWPRWAAPAWRSSRPSPCWEAQAPLRCRPR
jgi:MFS family permease